MLAQSMLLLYSTLDCMTFMNSFYWLIFCFQANIQNKQTSYPMVALWNHRMQNYLLISICR